MNLSPVFIAVFAFCFALAMGAVWEIYEFTMDSVFGTNMQKYMLDNGTALIGQAALQDTMKDIIVDAIDNATFHYANSYVKSLLEKSASVMEVENSTVCYKHETSG